MAELPGANRLVEVAGRLLLDAAYIFAEPTTDFVATSARLWVSTIELGDGEGWDLVVAAEEPLGKALAANLLGVDEASEEARAATGDAVGEWSNMVAGVLAEDLRCASGACRIGIPVVAEESGAALAARLQGCACSVCLSAEVEGRMMLALRPRGAS